MFSSISWGLFLTVIIALLAAYYLVIVTLYFPKEVLTLVLRKANRIKAPSAGQQQDERIPFDVIGAANETGDLDCINRFSAAAVMQTDAPDGPVPDLSLIESVSSLMEGIKTLFRVIKDAAGNKSDVLSMFPSLLAQYPLIPDSKYRFSINAFIHELCNGEFHYGISMDEVDGLWPVRSAA